MIHSARPQNQASSDPITILTSKLCCLPESGNWLTDDMCKNSDYGSVEWINKSFVSSTKKRETFIYVRGRPKVGKKQETQMIWGRHQRWRFIPSH